MCEADPNAATFAQGTPREFVINKIILPQQRSDFAIDLNCDGRVDNELGSIVSALASQNVDGQTSIDELMRVGQCVQLIRWVTDDPEMADHVGVSLRVGKTTPNAPDFSGAGQFTVDDSFASADFLGSSRENVFKSNPPPTEGPSDALLLPMFASNMVLPIFAAHIQFTPGTDAAGGAPGLLNGQLHGAIRAIDFAQAVGGPLAAIFTERLDHDPTGNAYLATWFDNGGCSDDGRPAQAGDMVITPCELLTSGVAQTVLAPDVDLLDESGHYAPNPANIGKDSISIGLGFTAVQATF